MPEVQVFTAHVHGKTVTVQKSSQLFIFNLHFKVKWCRLVDVRISMQWGFKTKTGLSGVLRRARHSQEVLPPDGFLSHLEEDF